MMSVSEGIEKEKALVQSFFKETLDLEFYDLRRTYAKFRLRAVDGIPVKSTILMDFYNDRVYMPINTRENYAGKLDVFIMGQIWPGKESCIGSYSQEYSKDAFHRRAENRHSIVDFVTQASSFVFERYNNSSGLLRRVNDPAYAKEQCLIHLGRKVPSLDAQIRSATLSVKPEGGKGHKPTEHER